MSITRHAVWWLALLAATLASGARAGEAEARVVVARLLTTGGEDLAASGTTLLDAASTGLAVAVRDEVRTVRQPLNTRLLDDLRLLPDGLAQALAGYEQAAGARYGFCLRTHEGQAGALVIELAAVDLEQRALLGYRTVAAVPTEAPAVIGGAVIELARQALPSAVLTEEAAQWRAAPSLTETVEGLKAVAEGALVRDAMETDPAAAPLDPRRQAPGAEVRPQPQLAAAPGEALLTMPKPPTPVRTAPLKGREVSQLMAQFASQMAGLGGLGEPSGRVRVLESDWELLLLPTATTTPDEPPLRVQVRVFGIDEDAEVELRCSRAVKVVERGRAGNWVSLDLPGYVPETDTLLDIERSGLLGLHVKSVEQRDTRIGFQLTGAGDVTFSVDETRREILAEVAKDESRIRLLEADGPLPFGGLFTVTSTSRGQASWYGGRWHGGPTASGERYNQWGWTAAHKTLPLGTWVRVTNLRNGKAVFLRINDRGPYVRGRIIDVSVTAAKALGFYGAGVTSVQVEALRPSQ